MIWWITTGHRRRAASIQARLGQLKQRPPELLDHRRGRGSGLQFRGGHQMARRWSLGLAWMSSTRRASPPSSPLPTRSTTRLRTAISEPSRSASRRPPRQTAPLRRMRVWSELCVRRASKNVVVCQTSRSRRIPEEGVVPTVLYDVAGRYGLLAVWTMRRTSLARRQRASRRPSATSAMLHSGSINPMAAPSTSSERSMGVARETTEAKM